MHVYYSVGLAGFVQQNRVYLVVYRKTRIASAINFHCYCFSLYEFFAVFPNCVLLLLSGIRLA